MSRDTIDCDNSDRALVLAWDLYKHFVFYNLTKPVKVTVMTGEEKQQSKVKVGGLVGGMRWLPWQGDQRPSLKKFAGGREGAGKLRNSEVK